MWWAGVLTSGKVPLEKTLETEDRLAWGQVRGRLAAGKGGDAHQQAGLSAGAVADNDEFPTELGHGGGLNWQALMQARVSESDGDGRWARWFVVGKKL